MSSSPKRAMEAVHVRDLSHGRLYQLETTTPVGIGGEAYIYSVQGEPSLVAKVYKRRGGETTDMFTKRLLEAADKLTVMLASRPRNPMEAQGHESYAWPSALIAGPSDCSVIGFLMPRIGGMREVFDFYNPGQRRKTCAYFDYRYLHQTARNIAGIMREVHSKGYIVGYVNQKNILVSDRALVTLIDTDSFQIRDPRTGRLYLCRVRTDGFIAPEVYKTGRVDVERTIEQDLFGLGVVIFLLLMEGVHPFSGRHPGTGEPPTLQQRVVSGDFPYGARSNLRPMGTAPPFDMLHADLRALFRRCFVDGYHDPCARPNAQEWQKALSQATKELRCCGVNEQHFYGAHLGDACPWCARVAGGLRDPFPRRSQSPATHQRVSGKRKALVWAVVIAFVCILVLILSR